MTSRASLLLVPVIGLLAGCGTSNVWYQSGKSAADTYRDFGECRMRAAAAPVNTGRNMSGLGVFMSAQIAQGDLLNACMLSKGYQPVPIKTVTNAASFPTAK
jgi:hypothetical protein